MALTSAEQAAQDFAKEAAAQTADTPFNDDDESGAGFEDVGVEQQAIPMLLICQTNSSDAIDAGVKPGEYYNSITKKSYGESIQVVVGYFQIAWLEWISNGGGFAGRHAPGSIKVTGNNYDGMTNPATGNKVVETWLYYVMLPDHKQDGFFVMSSTPGNMKYLKSWNSQMKFLRRPNGKAANIYDSIWKLTLGKDQNKAGQKYFSNKGGIERVGWITKELKTDYVEPLRIAAPKVRLQITAQPRDADVESESNEY